MKNETKLFTLVGSLVVLLTVGAFYLSFKAISQQATNANMASGTVFALMVDGAIVVYSIVRLYATWNGRKALAFVNLLLIVGFVGLSVWFNVGSELNVSPMVVTIHALPPLMLVLAFEVGFIGILTVYLDKTAVQTTIQHLETAVQTLEAERQTQQQTLDSEAQTLQQTIAELLSRRDKLALDIERLETKRQMKRLTERQEVIIKHIENNSGITSYDQLAHGVSLDKGQVYTPAKKLIEMGLVVKNGHGFEVVK